MNILNKKEILRKIKENITINDKKCWIWNMGTDKDGYGRLRVGDKTYFTHRLISYIYKDFCIYSKNFVCHTCDVPSCCNPDHLYIGDHYSNTRDAINRNRFKKGEEVYSSKLSKEDVAVIKKLLLEGYSHRKIAKMFKVAKNTISQIYQNKTWSYVCPIK